jgi:hypothetical protein
MADGRVSGVLRQVGGAALLRGGDLSDGLLPERFLRAGGVARLPPHPLLLSSDPVDLWYLPAPKRRSP